MSQSLDPILSQYIPLNNPITYNILPSTPRSTKMSVPFMLSYRNCTCIFHLSHAWHALLISSFLITLMIFSKKSGYKLSRHFLHSLAASSLRSRHSPQQFKKPAFIYIQNNW